MEFVQVDLGGGGVQEVQVDPRRGPLLQQRDGSIIVVTSTNNCEYRYHYYHYHHVKQQIY